MSVADVYARQRGSALKCPSCGGQRVGIAESRPKESGFVMRRRRLCTECHHRWTTFEACESVFNSELLLRRWLNVYRIEDMGVRAVKETA